MKLKFLLPTTALMVCTGCIPQTNSLLTPQTETKTNRSLGNFYCLAGNKLQMAAIQSFDEGVGFSKGYQSYVHNYLFFNASETSFTKLLDSNNYFIFSTYQFPNKSSIYSEFSTQTDCENSEQEVRWLMYAIVKRDITQDKKLTAEDRQILAISDVHGQRYTELIDNVETVYGTAYQKQPERLSVIYRIEAAKKVSVVDLATRKVISTELLPNLGNDVK